MLAIKSLKLPLPLQQLRLLTLTVNTAKGAIGAASNLRIFGHNCSYYGSFTGVQIFKDHKTRQNQYKNAREVPDPASVASKTNLITIPIKLAERLEKKREFDRSKWGQRRRSVEISRRGAASKPIIVCKRSELNHYYGQSYPKLFAPKKKRRKRGLSFISDKDDHIPLASSGWAHRKSTGDWFQIKKFAESYALQFEDYDYSGNIIGEVEGQEGEGEGHRQKPDFGQLGVIPELVEILNTAGISEPTVIQAKSIPTVLRGTNAVIASETGCGKTLCYLLPILQGIHLASQARNWHLENNTPLAIILVPSRELADQVYEQCRSLARPLNLHTAVLQGGNLGSKIHNPPEKIVHVLVSTPNVILELTKMQVYNLTKVQWVVLDEADSLLDDSFVDNVIRVVDRFSEDKPGPQNSQFLLVSATMPKGVEDILKESFPVADFETITTPGLHRIMGHVPQDFYRIKKSEKPEKLLELVKKDMESGTSVMIFCNKFQTCEWLNHYLRDSGFSAISLNGSLPSSIRRERIQQYLTGEIKILVCTDIASRGIDTIETGHVINYDFPRFTSDYIHRCGRTGRVGSRVPNAHVSSLIGWASESIVVQKIEKSVRKDSELRNVDANIKKHLDKKYGYGMYQPILAEADGDGNNDESKKSVKHQTPVLSKSYSSTLLGLKY